MKKPFFEKNNLQLYLSEWENRGEKYQYPQSLIFPKNTYSPWLSEDFFNYYNNEVKENTLVDIYRCFELYSFMRQLKETSGDIIEIGVWRGGTGLILQNGLGNNDSLYLCDTFEGVVKAGDKDNVYRGGEHSDTSLNYIEHLFKDKKGVQILKGIFPEETSFQLTDKTFKFCHIDVDVFQSALDVFDWIFPRLISGGIIVFDDYGFAACEGITTLVNEISLRNDFLMTYNVNGHAIIFKK